MPAYAAASVGRRRRRRGCATRTWPISTTTASPPGQRRRRLRSRPTKPSRRRPMIVADCLMWSWSSSMVSPCRLGSPLSERCPGVPPSRSAPRSPRRSPRRTRTGSSTATSSPATSCSHRRARSSSTSASRHSSARATTASTNICSARPRMSHPSASTVGTRTPRPMCTPSGWCSTGLCRAGSPGTPTRQPRCWRRTARGTGTASRAGRPAERGVEPVPRVPRQGAGGPAQQP